MTARKRRENRRAREVIRDAEGNLTAFLVPGSLDTSAMAINASGEVIRRYEAAKRFFQLTAIFHEQSIARQE